MTRENRTNSVFNYAMERGLYAPKKRVNGFCRTGANWHDGVECGEVYGDFWHVKIFDDGSYQIGWIEWRNGTTLITKAVPTIEEVKNFLDTQR